MKIVGVEFAPLNIPTRRRIQTFAVIMCASWFLFLPFVGTGIFLGLLFTPFAYISLLYGIFYLYDWNRQRYGGRRFKCIRRFIIWKYFRDFFPTKLHKTAELYPDKHYIFGCHPHGIMSAGAFSAFCTEATGFSKLFPDIKPHLVTLEGHFKFPIHRELLMATGICGSSKESIEWIVSRPQTGNAVVIVIGGAAEALNAHPGEVILLLTRRKGFVRLALKNGASLVPVFSFGENEIYTQVNNPEGSLLRSVQEKITKLVGVSPPLFHGRGIFQYTLGYIPYRTPINTVVGKPIDVPRIDNPTDEEVNHYHKLYIDNLVELFDTNKHRFGEFYAKLTLRIV